MLFSMFFVMGNFILRLFKNIKKVILREYVVYVVRGLEIKNKPCADILLIYF